MDDSSPVTTTGADDGGDARARRVIAAAGPLLADGTPANFAELLLARAAPEDLLTNTARDLALLAQDAWGFLADRKPGNVKLRLQSPLGGDRLGDISVIEIINDDKPFLLDSTMGELADLGVE